MEKSIFMNKKERTEIRKYQIITIILMLLILAPIVIKIFKSDPKLDEAIIPQSVDIDFDKYIIHCDALCKRFTDSKRNPSEALAYCEKYFEIDLDKNGKTVSDASILNNHGVCEDRVYCFNIKECTWGSSSRSRLTPEKCKDIMCDIYTEKYSDNTTAAKYIESMIEFGSCNPKDSELTQEDSSASWWTDTYQNVHCKSY